MLDILCFLSSQPFDHFCLHGKLLYKEAPFLISESRVFHCVPPPTPQLLKIKAQKKKRNDCVSILSPNVSVIVMMPPFLRYCDQGLRVRESIR